MAKVASIAIAEFLLARITEDEAVARAGLVLETGAGYEPVPGAEVGPLSPWQRRLLAECEAKRRIVEACDEQSLDNSFADPGTYRLADDVLRSLALPYADHPDYREEWRP